MLVVRQSTGGGGRADSHARARRMRRNFHTVGSIGQEDRYPPGGEADGVCLYVSFAVTYS